MPQPGQIAAAPAPAPAADASRITLRAKADAWMQVRDKAGQVILNRVLRAGETWPVPAKGGFLLTTGNAGGTEVLLDGAVIALGGEGAVRRDLPLDVDAIKDGKLAPIPAPAPVRPIAAATAPLPTTAPPPPKLAP
jgi:cytoskeleton protein RodZ